MSWSGLACLLLFLVVVEANIAIYYPFDGNYDYVLGECPPRTDIPGYQTATNVSFVPSLVPQLGEAVSSGNWSSYLNLGNFLLNSDTGSVSFTFWARMLNYDSVINTTNWAHMAGKDYGAVLFRIWVRATANYYYVADQIMSTQYVSLTSTHSQVLSNVWTHFALVSDFEKHTNFFYLNGTLVSSRATTGAPSDAISSQLQLFCHNGVSYCPKNLAIDDMRIYRVAISQTDVQRMINNKRTLVAPSANTTLALSVSVPVSSPVYLSAYYSDLDTPLEELKLSWIVSGTCSPYTVSSPNSNETTITFSEIGTFSVSFVVSDGDLCGHVPFLVTVTSSVPEISNNSLPATLQLNPDGSTSTILTATTTGFPEPAISWERYDATNITGSEWITIATGNPMGFVLAPPGTRSTTHTLPGEWVMMPQRDPSLPHSPQFVSFAHNGNDALVHRAVANSTVVVHEGDVLRAMATNPGGSGASMPFSVSLLSPTAPSGSASAGGLSDGAIAGVVVGPIMFALLCCACLGICCAVLVVLVVCVVAVVVIVGIVLVLMVAAGAGVAGVPSAVLVGIRLRGGGEKAIELHRPDFWELALGRVKVAAIEVYSLGAINASGAGDDAEDGASSGLKSDSSKLTERMQALANIADDPALCGPLMLALFAVLNANSRFNKHEDAAVAAVALSVASGCARHVFAALIKEDSKDEKLETLFRSSSNTTRLYTMLGRVAGLPFLFQVFASPLFELSKLAGAESCDDDDAVSDVSSSRTGATQADPGAFRAVLTASNIDSLLDQGGVMPVDSMDWELNALELRLMVQKVLVALLRSAGRLPPVMRGVLIDVEDAVRGVFEREGVEFSREKRGAALGSFFFLRFVTPALAAPFQHGLLESPPSARMQQRLVMFGRAFQNLSNRVLPGIKDPSFAFMNAFVSENSDKVDVFFDNLLNLDGAGEEDALMGPMPEDSRNACLAVLDRTIGLLAAKIVPQIEDPIVSKMIYSFYGKSA
jgi:hypothetical protein